MRARTALLPAIAAVVAAIPAGPAGAATPAAPAEATPAYTLPSGRLSFWTMSGDGATLGISSRTSDGPRIEIVDVATGAVRAFPATRASYSPPDLGLAADGRSFSYTTDRVLSSSRARNESVDQPTGVVVDLASGKARRFRGYDITISGTDGTHAIAMRGPIRYRASGAYQPAAVGMLNLTTGAFVKVPVRPTFKRPVNARLLSRGGEVLIYSRGTRCFALHAGTRAVTALGACAGSTLLALSPDGSTAFIGTRGWVDTRSGAVLPAGLSASVFSASTTRLLLTGASPDLSRLTATCWPGAGALPDAGFPTTPRTTYLIDRVSGLATPLVAPAGPVPTEGDDDGFIAPGEPRLTDAGDQVFWSDATRIYRQAATPAGPAAALPADCLPAS